MSQTYKATGINLKTMPLGESDRLVTVLTPEYGLVRAVAPGSRKLKSKLRGRIELFVVNELSLVKGRSLDKIIQAETLESYPGLSQDLGKLAASQYLAELVLGLGLSDQSQIELYELFNEHLRRLEQLPWNSFAQASPSLLISHLAHGIFHLLAFAGVAPQVHACCLSGRSLVPDLTDPHWQVKFSDEVGGVIRPDSLEPESSKPTNPSLIRTQPRVNAHLGAIELVLLQQLAQAQLSNPPQGLSSSLLSATDIETYWFRIEHLLRNYAQSHLGKSIRSATLIDTLLISDF